MDAPRKPVSLFLGRFPTRPTVEQVLELSRQLTGREPTAAEVEKTCRILEPPPKRPAEDSAQARTKTS
jgi:hypothetical protein